MCAAIKISLLDPEVPTIPSKSELFIIKMVTFLLSNKQYSFVKVSNISLERNPSLKLKKLTSSFIFKSSPL